MAMKSGLTLADETHDEGCYGHEGEDEEQDLGDFDCAGGNTTKAEHSSDKRYDEEDDCVIQHGFFSYSGGGTAHSLEPEDRVAMACGEHM